MSRFRNKIQAKRQGGVIPPVVKKAVAALNNASLNKMTKDDLEQLGRDTFNIELDKRKTKAVLIKEILEAQG
tara:strand:+ start:423 stop:638 length:216 start_codon:yes stop_codon:yes gene_type:complete